MEDRRKLINKIIIIVFLVMLIIGFTVPTLLDLGNEQNQPAAQQICQADANCYLTCDDKPAAVICLQNLCQRNSCIEPDVYIYNTTPMVFNLGIEISGEKLELSNLTNSQNFFVKFEENKVSVFTSGLLLKDILEKAKISLTAQCITTNQSYCSNVQNKLQMQVNGTVSYSYGNYVPQNGDSVEIVYS